MDEQDKIFEQLKNLFEKQPNSFNVIEEKIDIEIQLNYFKRSKKLKKQNLSKEEALKKAPILFDSESRFEEKRDVLIHLASFEEVETFRKVEEYWKQAEGEIKPWASMAYRESKMALESSLLDEKQILISTGLGGKGFKLRFFIVLINNEATVYSESQQKLVRNEIEYIVKKAEGELETVTFENEFAKILALIPLNVNVKNTINKIVDECNQYGNFLSENFLITNVKELELEEIYDVISTRLVEDLDEDIIEDFSDFDDEEFDDE